MKAVVALAVGFAVLGGGTAVAKHPARRTHHDTTQYARKVLHEHPASRAKLAARGKYPDSRGPNKPWLTKFPRHPRRATIAAAVATAPVNTGKPVITGTTVVGQTLTASSGTWTGTTPISYSYRWSNNKTAASIVLAPADVGNTITVTVTAKNKVGSATATSAPVGPVQALPPPPTTYSIGGTLSGLSGTVVLQLNGANDLSLSANGAFTFSTQLTSGSTYNVTVKSSPSGQTCSVANESGTVGSANVTNITVPCITTPPPACSNGYVALTYDDGPVGFGTSPTDTMGPLADALVGNGLHATFFDVGANEENNPSVVEHVNSLGMEFGDHSYWHVYDQVNTWTPQHLLTDATDTDLMHYYITGKHEQWFRPPFDQWYPVADVPAGMTQVTWTLDDQAYDGATATQIVNTYQSARNGDIVLSHIGYQAEVTAVPQIAAALKANGLCAGRLVYSSSPTTNWWGESFNATVGAW